MTVQVSASHSAMGISKIPAHTHSKKSGISRISGIRITEADHHLSRRPSRPAAQRTTRVDFPVSRTARSWLSSANLFSAERVLPTAVSAYALLEYRSRAFGFRQRNEGRAEALASTVLEKFVTAGLARNGTDRAPQPFPSIGPASPTRVKRLATTCASKRKGGAVPIQKERHGTHRKLHMAVRTAEQRKTRADNERKRQHKRRLKQLALIMPGLSREALLRASLRQISMSVRRAGAGRQGSLGAFIQAPTSSGLFSKAAASADLQRDCASYH